ncbi:MAG: hypothetical protein ACE37I_12045 [Rubinisphaera brasiliensis]|uniref:hypothetical protein n=1 Tax=Rubinisphaera brasiliensis TaxID=119 RepID=UPI00391B4F65
MPPYEDSAVSRGPSQLRRSCVSALKAGAATVVIGAVVAAAYFVTLPSAAQTDSDERKASFRRWKHALITPVGVTTLVVLPITCATASFASTFPPRPLTFVKSLLVVATIAAVSHLATAPVQGAANNTSFVLACIVGSGAILVALGFRSQSD